MLGRPLPLFLCILFSCSNLHHQRISQIAIQPILPYDSTQLPMIQQELTTFFHHPVIILPPITLPASFLNHSKGKRYSADSIINYLVQKTSDSITQIVGFTHTDIFTTERDRSGEIRQPLEKYAVWGIF